METTTWKENVILVDADYADEVAGRLAETFGQMLHRTVGRADLAQWLVCMALDAGVKAGENEVQVVLVHRKDTKTLRHFTPSDLKKELDGVAFRDARLGEFAMSAIQVENMVAAETYFEQAVATLADAKEIRRLVVVPNMEDCGAQLLSIFKRTDEKDILLLTMVPQEGEGFRNDLLGYSLINALGIRGEELQ